MAALVSFNDILEAADSLPHDQQESLVSILTRRCALRGRQRVIEDVKASLEEYGRGECKKTNVKDLMKELQS